jgi:hypothetical protein
MEQYWNKIFYLSSLKILATLLAYQTFLTLEREQKLKTVSELCVLCIWIFLISTSRVWWSGSGIVTF